MMNSRNALILVGVLALAYICCGDDAGQSRAAKVTSKAMDTVKNVAHKGAETVEKAADGVTVRVERFVNPEAHQPGESNLLMSAGRGVGRLIRNVTVEMARAAGSVGTTAMNLVKSTSGATMDTVRQAGQRIANPRGRSSSNNMNVETPRPSASNAEPEAEKQASEADGAAPAELTKVEE